MGPVGFVLEVGPLERMQDRQAGQWWKLAHEVLSAMKRAGMYVSPGDERVYQWLRQKLRRP